MKKNLLSLSLIALLAFATTVSCKKKSEPEPENQAPSISLTLTNTCPVNLKATAPSPSPVEPCTSFDYGTTLNFDASASDSDGTLTQIRIYDGSTLLDSFTLKGSSSSIDNTFEISDLSEGSHTITVKTTDDDGVTSTSNSITVTINSPIIIAM